MHANNTEKLILELKEQAKDLRKSYRPEFMYAINDMLDRAVDIVSRHTPAAVPSKSEVGLFKKMDDWLYSKLPYWQGRDSAVMAFIDAARSRLAEFADSPAPPDEIEPLAVLADRKGYWIAEKSKLQGAVKQWCISIARKSPDYHTDEVFEDTYAAAEDKARAFLNTLEDKKI